jgi:hypothetical protein
LYLVVSYACPYFVVSYVCHHAAPPCLRTMPGVASLSDESSQARLCGLKARSVNPARWDDTLVVPEVDVLKRTRSSACDVILEVGPRH